MPIAHSAATPIGTPVGDRRTPIAELAAVVHARVGHREHGGLFVGLERGVDDLADEQRVITEVERVPDLAVDVRNRLVEDRRTGDAVVEREAVQRARGRDRRRPAW